MKILLDTDVLIALVKADDSNHNRVIKLFKKHNKAGLFISQLCIAEAATVLSYRLSQNAARLFLENIRKRNIQELLPSLESIRSTDKIFLSQSANGTSWIDCHNVTLMQLEKLDAIASFDKFYSKFKFTIIK